MAKILLLIVVGIVIYAVVKGYTRNLSLRRDTPPAQGDENLRRDMVRCAQCGVHTPRSEGIFSRNKFFCTEEHRLLHFKS